LNKHTIYNKSGPNNHYPEIQYENKNSLKSEGCPVISFQAADNKMKNNFYVTLSSNYNNSL